MYKQLSCSKMADKSHSSASSGTDLQVIKGSRLSSKSSDYLVLDLIGKGTFAKVAKCVKLATDEKVAVRIKKKPSASEANKEAGILQKMRDFNSDLYNFVRWDNWFIYKAHLCEEFELLDITLKEYVNMRQSSPLLLQEIHFVVYQVATALQLLKKLGIAHGDLQPENIMLVDHIRQPLKVKLIGFGSACEVSKAGKGSYMPHLSYRAPETILGLPCNEGIDMWSLGCIAAELFLGNPLYPACCDYETVWMITQTQGRFPRNLLNAGLRTSRFYRKTWPNVWKLMTPYGRRPRIDCKFSSLDDLKNIQQHDHPSEQDAIKYKADLEHFVELVKRMLELDPAQRIRPRQVLAHPFMTKSYLFDLCCPQSSSSLVPNLQPPSESQASTSRSSCGVPNSPQDPLTLPKEEKNSIATIKPRKKTRKSSAEISQVQNRGPGSSSPVSKKRPCSEMSEGGVTSPEIYSPERKRKRITVESEERDTSKVAPSTVIQLTAQRIQEDRKETDKELSSPSETAPSTVIQSKSQRTQEDSKETDKKDTELPSSSKAALSTVIQPTAQRMRRRPRSLKKAPYPVIQLKCWRKGELTKETEETDKDLPSVPKATASTVIKLTSQRMQADRKETGGTDTETPSSLKKASSTVIQPTAQMMQEDRKETDEKDTELPSSSKAAPSTVIQPTAQRTQVDRKETDEYVDLPSTLKVAPSKVISLKDFRMRSRPRHVTKAPSTVIQLTAQRIQEDRKETDKELSSPSETAPSTVIQSKSQRTQEDSKETDKKDTELPSSSKAAPSTVIQPTAQRAQVDRKETDECVDLPSTLKVAPSKVISLKDFRMRSRPRHVTKAPSTVIQLTAQRIQEDRKETDKELSSPSETAPSTVIQSKSQRTQEDSKETDKKDTELPSSSKAAPSTVIQPTAQRAQVDRKETDECVDLPSTLKVAPSKVISLKDFRMRSRPRHVTKAPSTVIQLTAQRIQEDRKETDKELSSPSETAPSTKETDKKDTELPSSSKAAPSTVIQLTAQRIQEDRKETDKELSSPSETAPSTVIHCNCPKKKEDKRETYEKDKGLQSTSQASPTTENQVSPQKMQGDRKRRDKDLPSTSQASPTTEIQFRSPRKKKNRTKIWIIGSSYIRRAEDAAYENFGQNFGLNAKVEWFGKGGMRWSGVLPRFYTERANAGSPPDILVIHAGGNDLGLVPTKDLASTMEQDLTQLCAEFPSMTVVYSCINQRQAWRYLQPFRANNARKTVNKVMRKAVQKLSGEVIEHPRLHSFDDNIFLADGVHFTKSGNAIFVSSIHSALNKILQKSL